MTWDDVALVLIDLEHDDMTVTGDHRFQNVCAHIAQLVTDVEVAALLERAAVTCHHCNPDRQGNA